MKKMMAALIVALLRTLPVSAPKVASAMPPPMAEPMPPSDLAFCISTTRMRNSETRIRTKVKIARRTLMGGLKAPKTGPRVKTERAGPLLLDPQQFQDPLQVLVAAVLDHDPALLGRMEEGHPGPEVGRKLLFDAGDGGLVGGGG